MSWTATYDSRGCAVCFTDLTDSDEVLAAHRAIFVHPYEEGLQYVLADFSAVERLDLSLVDLLQMAEHDRQYLLRNPTYLAAMIAPQAHVSALMRTFAGYMEGSQHQSVIVSSRSDALAWLNDRLTSIA